MGAELLIPSSHSHKNLYATDNFPDVDLEQHLPYPTADLRHLRLRHLTSARSGFRGFRQSSAFGELRLWDKGTAASRK